MKKLINLVCFGFVMLLIGCSGSATLATPTIPHLTPTTSPSLTIIPSPSIAISMPKKTKTIAPSATPTETVSMIATKTPPAVTPQGNIAARLQFQCLEILPRLPDGATSSGILVLESEVKVDGIHNSRDTFLLDMATGQTIQIAKPGENQIYHTVSPDRKHLAYNSSFFDENGETILENLIIATADGQQVISTPWEKGWGDIPGWLNNERLVINIAGLNPVESEALKAATLLALNPFSGERQILKPDFPGIYDFHPVYYWAGWSVRTYDPALTRAAYLQVKENGEWALTLWNLNKRQPIASLIPYRVSMPIWSPDGSRLVTNAPVNGKRTEELFLMSRDGQIEQLTNLNAYSDNGMFYSYSWSPDGRYIATWMKTKVSKEVTELVTIDTRTRQITDYCISLMDRSELIWSPDGSQLVLYDRYEEDHSRVILVDLVKGFAAQIATDMEPMGWMLAP